MDAAGKEQEDFVEIQPLKGNGMWIIRNKKGGPHTDRGQSDQALRTLSDTEERNTTMRC